MANQYHLYVDIQIHSFAIMHTRLEVVAGVFSDAADVKKVRLPPLPSIAMKAGASLGRWGALIKVCHGLRFRSPRRHFSKRNRWSTPEVGVAHIWAR